MMGYRLAVPADTPPTMDDLMRACWSTQRPTFQSIVANIEAVLSTESPQSMVFDNAVGTNATKDYTFVKVNTEPASAPSIADPAMTPQPADNEADI